MPPRKGKFQHSKRNLIRGRQTRWDKTENKDGPCVVDAANSQKVVKDNSLICTFEKKLTQSKTEFTPMQPSKSGRVILDLDLLISFLDNFFCPTCCGKMAFGVNKNKSKGFIKNIEGKCSTCNESLSFYTSRSNKKQHNSKHFTINHDMVVSSMLMDMGPYKLNKFCEGLNLPGLHHKTYTQIAEEVRSDMVLSQKLIFQRAAAIVRKSNNYSTNDDNTPIDIAVSFDGTWLTRGHSSLIGIGCVIEVQSGLVLDMYVVSLHCNKCAQKRALKDTHPRIYQKWLDNHKQKGCSINFKGVSGMMETEAADVLWRRSLQLHNFRYTTMIGDGDSKAFDRLNNIKPYGSKVTIKKEECLNHVSKRLGTALRNLVQDCSKKGITLGGKKPGSLTADKIKKLSTYYARAIRGNENAEQMKKAILASLHHNYSTDEYPQHQFCPPGKDSWCFYKKDVSEKKYPGGHSTRVHTFLDFERLHKHIWPIYERLSDIRLLKRCELRTTQNSNESLHSVIWSRCSKLQFHNKQNVEFSALCAICEFNFGPVHSMEFLKTDGEHSLRLCTARQQKRLNSSQDALAGLKKERVKKQKSAIKKAQMEYVKIHGTTGYGAGQF